MKKILCVLAVVLALCLEGCMMVKPKFFKSLACYPQTTSVRIPRGMMMSASAFGALGDEDFDYGKVTCMEVFVCEHADSQEAISRDVAAIASGEGMELLLETRDGDDMCRIYGVAAGDGPELKKAIICSYEPQECSLVFVKGKIRIPQD